ncbi:hypothetical protein [Parasitella parasitica]|uniref:GAT domain-containing protein n=1 Tax=Parasitella parasitica TaxID=35722 RepID=A0A0B7MU39_9FUNG|nr:hypothetical protein [Parasitella parasitica]
MPLFSKKIVPTDITANIEKATDVSVSELDWELIFQICNSVNSTDTGAKEARKLLQKKMNSNEPKTQVLALENVDDRVHGKLAQCLQAWVGQAGGDPQYGAVRRAHDVMMNGAALAGTNRRQVHGQSRSTHANTPREPPKPADVKGDIKLANNSAQLFSQTLSFTDPTQEDISKNELIQEFYGKCRHAQQIVASHLETCEDSEIISALINTNNELLSCFKSYDEMLEQATVNQATVNSQSLHDRTSRNNEELRQQQNQQQDSSSSSRQQSQTHHDDLSPPSAAAQSKNPYQIHSTPSNDPFDPFADTNQASSDTANAGASILPPPLIPQKMHE